MKILSCEFTPLLVHVCDEIGVSPKLVASRKGRPHSALHLAAKQITIAALVLSKRTTHRVASHLFGLKSKSVSIHHTNSALRLAEEFPDYKILLASAIRYATDKFEIMPRVPCGRKPGSKYPSTKGQKSKHDESHRTLEAH
ncbi:MAG: hypothetical protein LCH53_14035 [Bacteroidetes bacterium]|nr:hypothetical protein [Bacteroidota bacterium]